MLCFGPPKIVLWFPIAGTWKHSYSNEQKRHVMNSTPMLQDSAFVFAIHATPKNPNPTQFSPLVSPSEHLPKKLVKGQSLANLGHHQNWVHVPFYFKVWRSSLDFFDQRFRENSCDLQQGTLVENKDRHFPGQISWDRCVQRACDFNARQGRCNFQSKLKVLGGAGQGLLMAKTVALSPP